MKRIPVILALMFLTACAGRMKVQLPVTCSFGGCGRTPISASIYGSPFYTRLVALSDTIVDCAAPGTSLYDPRNFEFETTELPIAALYYAESTCTNLVGISGEVLRIERGRPATFVADPTRMKRLDGAQVNYVTSASSRPATDIGGSYEAGFPRIAYLSEQPIQVLNPTNFRASVRLNGREVGVLGPGRFHVYRYWMTREYAEVDLEIVYSNGSHYSTRLSLSKSPQGPRAHQVLVGCHEISPPCQ